MRPQLHIATKQLELPQLDKRRSQPRRHSVDAVALIHCLSGETGPLGDIQGLNWVPPSCLHRSVFRGLNWKRENDVRGRDSVVKRNDPGPPQFLHNIFSLCTLLGCSRSFTLLSFIPVNTHVCLYQYVRYSFLYVTWQKNNLCKDTLNDYGPLLISEKLQPSEITSHWLVVWHSWTDVF